MPVKVGYLNRQPSIDPLTLFLVPAVKPSLMGRPLKRAAIFVDSLAVFLVPPVNTVVAEKRLFPHLRMYADFARTAYLGPLTDSCRLGGRRILKR